MSRKNQRPQAQPSHVSIRAAVRCALAGLVTLAIVPPVLAGPDPCSTTATSRTCEGNQSNGVSFTTAPSTLVVQNLSTSIARWLYGEIGVRLSLNGGAGGDGGWSIVGAGGDGDTGGTGGLPLVNFVGGDWSITTAGDYGYGILVQANGGAGGDGGWATGAPIPPLFVLTGPAFGGDGGAGGNGGQAAVSVAGSITTSGSYAHGIFAESQAGSGGDGGWAFSTTYAEGGNGGVGGDGGSVSIGNSASISTSGLSAFGILGRSFGGTGGGGGEGDGLFGAGGAGLGSGDGGYVSVINSGGIVTGGADATGIFAQSVGGFAGGGGGAGALFAWGGSGSSAGRGGDIDVVNSGTISTTGNFAFAIHGQSVGGGGGSGGSTSGVFSWGGSGQAGGNGGTVTIHNLGGLDTLGADAAGIFAQSVGGGGGSGGDSGSVGAFFSLALGGTGGPGGDGGVVTVASDTGVDINTAGSRAAGIFAQSVGGGGGNGGYAVSLSAGVGVSASVAIGGNGNEGGDASAVTVDSASTINTTGNDSHGIRAESIGGGGGFGGGSISAAASDTFSAAFAFGGKAGGGGDGSSVTVSSSGAISVEGERSAGIAAMSLGGGGGSGGWTITASGAGVGALNVGIGGEGGLGGDSGAVTVSNAGTIDTQGLKGYGIDARSIGGGGGDGGWNLSGAGAGGAAGLFTLGGRGGGGGDGDAVTVSNSGAIHTLGVKATGIVAESVGGGGGDGGWGITGAGAGGGALTVTVGGSGGDGGDGDAVIVANDGSILTEGEQAYGIRARSLGGGGGDGGFTLSGAGAGTAAGTFTLGGRGGGGGDASTVTVGSNGAIQTLGDKAVGILAASVGGGGGDGGWTIAGSGAGTGALSVTIGGAGGDGGDGSDVTVTTTSDIATAGTKSHGIRARSIGGGGGDGGFALSGAGAGTGAMTFNLGGSGGLGGASGIVDVTSSGTITTGGASAAGILAESIGGGGGDGGFSITGAGAGWGAVSVGIGGSGGSGGPGSQVTVSSGSDIFTAGERSHGIRARSIGGGGGDGGFSISGAGAGTFGGTFNLGGSGATGGDAGIVTVTSTGTIETSGVRAAGILAESIGGGGGDGGFSITGSGGGTAALSVGVGGGGDGGGDAAAVTVDSTSAITTEGERAHAIRARSIGGGGGDGGFSLSGAGAGSFGATFSLGGSGGAGGFADAVTVSSTGALSTTGSGAAGILAESIGGGGGDGGWSITGAGGGWGGFSVGIGGFGDGGGDGGSVLVTSSSSITTLGDKAYGIRARSIGGGGGDGGFSISGAGGGDYGGTFNLGGYGDQGGHAQGVTVSSSGEISTSGYKAAGILAESIGGGGGDGGFSITGSGAGTGALSIGIGGGGAAGGNAAGVTVTNDGSITTTGEKAHGIRARSIGGGGGDGAFSITGSGAGDYSGTFSLGGFADDGGDGAAVNVVNNGVITVSGKQADGILASSVGGGGGNGGWSVSGSGAGNGAFNVNIGGFGGDGGFGGTVDVTNTQQIVSTGAMGRGIVATSLGGGGGDGGFSFVGSFSAEGGKNLGVSLGGFGGDGSTGGAVHVVNDGLVDISAAGSHGIVATSTGGGGGNGGASYAVGLGFGGAKNTWNVNVSTAVGGFGGIGNTGGAVLVENDGTIVTRNHDAHGILATSIGGGGGDGGSSFAATIALAAGSEGRTINGSISVGGFGGDGNTGGTVDVVNTGGIYTVGDKADAIHAQSIGGGGGNGGKSTGLSLLLSTGGPKLDPKKGQIAGGNWNAEVRVGGDGGTGSHGGQVTVVNEGDISTEGALSRGIVAQSIGAGGGSGGDAVKGTDTALDYVALANNMGGAGKLNTVLKQLRNWSFIVGGDAGASGNAADVIVENLGSITTRGFGATAIFVQSIGGGGGESQNYVQAIAEGGTATAGAMGKVGIGGAGGAAGDGGNIDVDHSGDIVTLGDEAYGIYAQSIGGGGGKAGNIDRALADGNDFIPVIKNIGLGLSFGRDGGGGGDGGTVTITTDGNIYTAGADSAGIHAQSVGGGGGEVGSLPNEDIPVLSLLSFKGSVGAAGSGGAVSVSHSGNITTAGPASDGIFAQSAGGQGTGGLVSVDLWGDIQAQGVDSSGIVAQSLGQGGNSDISVTIHAGTVWGGTGDAAGVYLHDGASNVLDNWGAVTTVTGIDGNAIVATGGDDLVANHGVVAGSLALGAGSNAFDNLVGASLLSGSTIDLGGDLNLLTNDGTLSTGGAMRVLGTSLTGSLVQGSTGELLVDLNVRSGAADHLAVSGSADLAGSVSLNLLEVGRAMPSSRVVEILSGQGLVTDAGLELVDIDTAVFWNELLFEEPGKVVIQSVIDFSPEGLNRNQRAIGEYVNDIQVAGSSPAFEPIATALFYLPDVGSLAGAYDALSPESYAQARVGSVLSSMEFGDALLSCRAREGQFRFVDEDECGWMRVSYRELDRDRDRDYLGFDESAVNVAFGVQGAVSERWYAGFAMSFEDLAMDTGRLASSDGTRVQAGFVMKGRLGANTLSAGITGGHGSFDARRRVDLPSPGVDARADYDQLFYAGTLRWAHVFEMKNWYVQPSLDLAWTHLDVDAFQEKGAGAAGIHVRASAEDYTTASPMLELGGEIQTAGGTLVRPFVRLGVDYFMSGLDPKVAATFDGAPAGVDPFTVRTDAGDTHIDVAAGVDFLGRKGTVLRLNYVGQFGEEVDGSGVFLRISKPL